MGRYRRFVRSAAVLSTVVTVVAALAAVPAGATPVPGGPGGYVLQGGATAPVYSYANAIRQSVFVTTADRDGDGHPDRVAADIIRPRELDGNTRIPVIMDASPYYSCCGRGNESQVKTYAADGTPQQFPLFYDNYFVPRGYAVVLVDMAGTNRSTGCVDEGAASDVQSVRSVIDWLNGRASAVDLAGRSATSYWANGSVGMIGKSYDGTLANAVAATGVAGLKTIVPISAISSWYDYDRAQRLPYSYNYPSGLSSLVEQDRTENVNCAAVNNAMDANDADNTGAYTPFWSVRDYRAAPSPQATNVTASVFLVHGLEDTNVKMINAATWLSQLQDAGVTTKVWFSRLGHTDPFDYDRANWVKTLHLWFDNQLLGITNGILSQPRVRVETAPGVWQTSSSWPVSDSTNTLHPAADGSLGPQRHSGTVSFTNQANQSENAAVAPNTTNPHRLLFMTAPLASAVRISGTPQAVVNVSQSASPGQLAVALVDYGNAVRVPDNGEGNVTGTTRTCWGSSVSYDSACYLVSQEQRQASAYQVLARGWIRLAAGQHSATVTLAPNDVTVPQGHRLGLAVYSASPDWAVVLDSAPTTYTVSLSATHVDFTSLGAVSFGGPVSPMTYPAPTTAARPDPAARLPE